MGAFLPVGQPLRVLVTGGTGFLGRAAVDALRREGHTVHVYARSQGQDVRDLAAFAKAATGHDTVVHLAGLRRAPDNEVFATHLQGTLNACEASLRTGARLVLASTAGAYAPRNAYAFSKALAEDIVGWYASTKALSAGVLRIFNVYGEGDAQGVVARFERDDPITVHGNKDATFDFVHVDDVARALALCVRPEGLATSDVGTGKGTTVDALAHLFGKRIVYRPDLPDLGIHRSIAEDVRVPGWAPRVELTAWVQRRRAAP